MAGAVGYLSDLNDQWLKPRLLRAVVSERLPQPGSTVPPSELASILEALRTHGILTEAIQGPPDRKLAEAWRASVDAWVDRVTELVESDSPYSCWLGTCFLGVTFQECSNERFVESYSDWFEKILRNLQEPSSLQLATVVSCTSMSDLFVRLAKFLNLKKEASSFAGRVVEPLLLLLNENGPVSDEAIDLLRTVVKLYPSSLNRHYQKVESAIAAKVMSTEVNVKSSKKFARVLAMLPSVRVSEGSWSLMIQRILIGINNILNDAFIGLEEEKKGREIMMLLVPPGSDPPPVLGDQIKLGGNLHVTKKFRVFTVPTISALAHSCCVMLTSYYPVQVNVPVRALLALLRRVLLVDGSLHNKKFPSTTSLHQELICFELPSLHSSFLDLLHATIKGMRSQLLPHAANIVRLITDYFEIAKLPAMRTKVYSIVQLLLTSMGVGMSLHLLEVIVSNAVGDLDDSCVSEITLFSINPSKVTNESSSKSYSKKRKQEPQIQNSHASALEKAAISPKKRKTSSTPTTSKGKTPETAADVKIFTPLCVKIAALETLEILLNVGGSLRTDHWRAKVDLLLVNISRSACDSGSGYEQSTSTVGKTSISDFRLASLKALLASFLSSPYARPPYLAQGIELFRRGKLEIGTSLAEFCSRALLALDVLTHPRALSLEMAGPLVPGLNCSGPEKIVFGARTSKFSQSEGHRQIIEDEDSDDDWLPSTKDNEPTEVPTLVKEVPQIDSRAVPVAVQDVPAYSKNDANMVDAAAEETNRLKTVDNPTSSNAVQNPIYSRPPETQKSAVAPLSADLVDRLQNKSSAVLQKESSTVNGPSGNLGTSYQTPSDLVERLQSKSSAVLQKESSAVNEPSGNLGTSYQTPSYIVERLQNKSSAVLQKESSAVNGPSGNLGTSYQTPSDPGVASGSHNESSATCFTLPVKPALSDAESEDSMPDIVDADPDSDFDY